MLDERALVNGLVALLASGGSTNHSIHMVALARAAGLELTWDDLSDLSDVVPLLVRMYPNGPADVNAFEQAGAVPGLMRRLAEADLIHLDATPVFGEMQDYLSRPALVDGKLVWQPVGRVRIRACCPSLAACSRPQVAPSCSVATWAAPWSRSQRSPPNTG